jgi:uncharacterized membrane protein (DUF2068 family)
VPPAIQTFKRASAPQRVRALALIAAYKLAKMLACLLLAAVAFDLVRPQAAAWFSGWLESLSWATRHDLAVRVVDWLLGLGPHEFRLFGSVALLYAAMYAVEGVGLWYAKRWAEYLVIVETCLLLPLEVRELLHRFSAFKLGLLLANIGVVMYLIHLLRTHSRKEVF